MSKANNPIVTIGVFTVVATLIIALIAGKPQPNPRPTPPPVVGPVNPVPPRPVPPEPPRPTAEPGDNVPWINYPPRKTFSDPTCGPVLTDIERHIDPKHGTQYRFKDLTVWGHETTHGVNSDIRMTIAKHGQNGFYCLDNRAMVLTEPRCRITDVAPLVPQAVRGGRYNLYLVQQARSWNDMPTYILDEWVAYINGCEVAADQIRNGLFIQDGKSDEAISVMEFSYYALALCKAIKENDPTYFASHPEFAEFVAFNVRRSARLFRELIVDEHFSWDDQLITTFIESDATADLKAVAAELWGRDFAAKYLLTK